MYESLKKQKNFDSSFEWIVINNGSTDQTDELMQELIKENEIAIHYIQKQNGGKQRAYNEAVQIAKGDYFICMDGDDYFTEDAFQKIEYTVNEKINAIAPKITDKGASAIQTQITDEFIKTASSTLLKVFNEIGYDIDSNLVSINKVKSMILSTDENLDTIDGYTQQVLDLQKQLPSIKEKLNKANEFVDYLPQVDEMGQKVVALNDKMPQLQEQAKIILDLQQKIPEIQNAGRQIAEIDQDFSSIQETMDQGITEAKQGLSIIQQVQEILPDVKKWQR